MATVLNHRGSLTSPVETGNANKNQNIFDSIEIQPCRQNFGTITKNIRPTVSDLSMGNLAKHFDENTDVSSPNIIQEQEDEELNENDAQIKESTKHKNNKISKSEKKKFGTFDGVLARCLLCIWGVIMYLRTGWIVGNAGIWQTIIIMILASSVTFLTSLSLSAICTNGEVKSGGYYFLISRSLGPEFGGVIGILFAFANCISVAMYLAGFSETIVAQYAPHFVTNSETWDTVLWAEVTLIGILLLALRGVGGIIKFDMVLLVVLVVSIIVYFIGTIPGVTKVDIDGLGYTGYDSKTFSENWHAAYMDGEDFISVFAVFFPAVTGEMAGANISGDLRNPSYSIPNGTLSAIVISTIVYIGIALSLGGAVLRSVGTSEEKGLYFDYQIMPKVSAFAPLVIVGIFASTLSSGMSCFVGAPRIFQAVCQDKLFPQLIYFAKGRDKDGEPVRAYFIVFVICFLAILTGNINFIAPIITNFFLITYAVMNYSTFTWSLTRSPGWRPTFKWYNKWISLFASAECIALMFLVDWMLALITIVICFILYKYVDHIKPNVEWGTASEAIIYVDTCAKLLKYQTIKDNAKVSRPKFLILNKNIEHLKNMYDLTQIMNQKHRGMTMVGDIIIGDSKDHEVTNRFVKRARNHEWSDIPSHIIENSLIQNCIAPNFTDGARTILQTAGVGAIKPNVALFNISDFQSEYVEILQDALLTGMGVMLVASQKYMDWTIKRNGFIDIWWLYDDGGLTVFIPYLLQSHELFKDCKLRIMALENLGYSEQNELAALMTKLRIKCEIVEVGTENEFGGKIEINVDGNSKESEKSYSKTPRDDVDADFSLVEDDKNQQMDKGNNANDNNKNHNTLLSGSKLVKSSFVDNYQKSLRHEVFTYDHIDDLNPAKNGKKEKENENMKISEYAKRKLTKYKKLGKLIEKSKDSDLCIVTMPFPRAEYTKYEYMKILESLTPKNMDNLIFVRGNQDQVLTFAL